MHKKKCLIELPLITIYEFIFLKYLMIQVQGKFIIYTVHSFQRQARNNFVIFLYIFSTKSCAFLIELSLGTPVREYKLGESKCFAMS